MKKTLLTIVSIFALFLTGSNVNAQPAHWAWAQHAGSTGRDWAGGSNYNSSTITTDAAGNSYVTGMYEGTATFGSFTISSPLHPEVFTAKYGPDGTCLWVKHFGGDCVIPYYLPFIDVYGNEGCGISIDAAGNCYVAGLYHNTAGSTISFGPDVLTSTGGRQIFVVKYDQNGNEIWARQATNASDINNYCKCIATDAAGNSYISGYLGTTGVTFGTTTLTAPGAFVTKYDANGNVLWATQVSSAGGTDANSIALDASGNCFITGYMQGTETFACTTPVTITSLGERDVFVAKVTNSGVFDWITHFGGTRTYYGWDFYTGTTAYGKGISTDPSGNIYLSGDFDAPLTMGSTTLTTAGAFFAKLDASGNVTWAKQSTGTPHYASGRTIKANAAGESFVAGTYGGATYGAFVTKLDASGNEVWQELAIGGGTDFTGISLDGSGNVYASGSVYTAQFGCQSITSFGGSDLLITKINPSLISTVATGTANVCVGSFITLTDPTPGGTWSTASAYIADLTTGTSNVNGLHGGLTNIIYATPSGCLRTTAVTVNPAPTPFILTSSCACGGSAHILLSGSQPGFTYQLLNGSSIVQTQIGPSTGSAIDFGTLTGLGTYTVRAIDPATSCTLVMTGNIVISGSAGSTLPTVTAVSPYLGNTSSTVTISGTNFNVNASGNIVYFGATKAVVSSVNATGTSMNVTVPVGATYMPVSVLNTDCYSLTGYSQYPFLPTYDNSAFPTNPVSFNAKVSYATGANPWSVAIGDLNGDGKPDMVVTNLSSNTISVYKNTSTSGTINSSSFTAQGTYATGSQPYSVAMGDLAGDGNLDVVVTNYASNTVSVFRNAGPGASIAFLPKTDYATAINPMSVAIADLDKDGKPEIATANYGAGSVSILRNTTTCGAGMTFAPKVDISTGAGTYHPYSIAIGDLNGDGLQDIAVAVQNMARVCVFRNISVPGTITSASFAAPVNFATGNQPYSVAIGDIDGDGKMDMAVANNADNTISLFRNTSTGSAISFGSNVNFVTGTSPYCVAIADIDGDGKADVVTANSTSNNVSVFRNTATSGTLNGASLAARVNFGTDVTPRLMAIGDLDGDGRPDIAVANISSNTVAVLRRNNPGYWRSASENDTIPGITELQSASDVRLFPNPNNGTFTVKGSIGTTQVAPGGEEVTMEITNMLGQVVYMNKITTLDGNINTQITLDNTLANGIYLMNLHTMNEKMVLQIVIKK